MKPILLVLAVLSTLCVASCGGGGGGAGGGAIDDTPAPPLPTRGAFGFGNSGTAALAMTFNTGGASPTITATNIHLTGTYDLSTATWTLNQASNLSLDCSSLFSFQTLYVITNSAAVVLSTRAHPTSGWIEAGLGGSGGDNPHVTVEFLADTVVIRQTHPEYTQSFWWNDFLDVNVADTATPQPIRVAALAYHALEFLTLGPVAFSASSFQMIGAQENALVSAGSGKSVRVNGDACPGVASGTGCVDITWTDVDTADPVGPSDKFEYSLNKYWKNDATSTDTWMFATGKITNTNYMENHSPLFLGTDVLTFSNAGVWQISKQSGSTYASETQLTLNGQVAVNFTE